MQNSAFDRATWRALGGPTAAIIFARRTILWLLGISRDGPYVHRADDVAAGSGLMALERAQVLLIVVAEACGDPLTPVQLQKSLFLAGDKAPTAFLPTSRYDFQPYDYGPFDRNVYVDAEELGQQGLLVIGTDPQGRWNTYAATSDGIRIATGLRKQLNDGDRAMLARIVKFTRSLSFTDLVSAIYRGYPHMRERSVFRD